MGCWYCPAILSQAQQLDKIGRLNERVVDDEACGLDEANAAFRSLAAVGMEESALFERVATIAAQLRAKE